MIPLREGRGGSQSPHGPIHFGAVSLKSKYINLSKQKCIFSKALSHFSYKHKNNYGRIIMTYLKRPWCWERLRAGGDRDDRGWDGCMASLTQWTWVSELWESATDREACRAAVHGVRKSGTQLSEWTELNWIMAERRAINSSWSWLRLKEEHIWVQLCVRIVCLFPSLSCPTQQWSCGWGFGNNCLQWRHRPGFPCTWTEGCFSVGR